jgi:hypothetical protein
MNLPRRSVAFWGLPTGCAAGVLLAVIACRVTADDIDRAPIRYSASKPDNVISRLDQRLRDGKLQLPYDRKLGYLPAVLRELGVPPSSQMLVYSKTSFQRKFITPRSPRALYFNDDVYVGYCDHGEVLEFSATDPQLGTVFYTLDQDRDEKPRFTRQGESCLLCHCSSGTRGVPGHLVRSVVTGYDGNPLLSAGSYRVDHTTPLERRWGGWYVTGTHGKQTHLGNLVVRGRTVQHPIDNAQGQNVVNLEDRVDLSDYLTRHSDLVALLVLEHQAEGHNLITQALYQTRQAVYMEEDLNKAFKEGAGRHRESTLRRVRSVGEPLVKYLLFSGEAPLAGKVAGTTKFAAEFAARGPRDPKGRSLRDLDLEKRLFKYPCSYLVYSESFDALPGVVRAHVLERLWEVLCGQDTSAEFSHLTAADRQAIREILVATKPNLPAYWRQPPKSETP